jgi:excisionase family DNA binding protein
MTMKNNDYAKPILSTVYTTTGQAAASLLVNRLTIQRWIKEGKLHGERVGRITLILKEDVRKVALERGIGLSN